MYMDIWETWETFYSTLKGNSVCVLKLIFGGGVLTIQEISNNNFVLCRAVLF